jgi:glycerophosphoryl diester phosphodiesterase
VARVSVIAHRGMHCGVRENTLEAFATARELGCDGVELDVRVSSDGSVVIHHDPALSGGELIATMAAGELPSWLPGLDEALGVLEGMEVIVELKTDLWTDREIGAPVAGFELAQRAARIVASHLGNERRETRVTFSSLNPSLALEARRVSATTRKPTGAAWVIPALLVGSRKVLDLVREASAKGLDACHFEQDLIDEQTCASCHDLGMSVAAWTVNDAERMASLAARGIDAIITDEPRKALDVRA